MAPFTEDTRDDLLSILGDVATAHQRCHDRMKEHRRHEIDDFFNANPARMYFFAFPMAYEFSPEERFSCALVVAHRHRASGYILQAVAAVPESVIRFLGLREAGLDRDKLAQMLFDLLAGYHQEDYDNPNGRPFRGTGKRWKCRRERSRLPSAGAEACVL